jgi:hypothetical protein
MTIVSMIRQVAPHIDSVDDHYWRSQVVRAST